MARRPKKPHYIVSPRPPEGDTFNVVNLNGRGRIHGIEIVGGPFASREAAQAWIDQQLAGGAQ
jgi:hypothetical protein